VWPLRLRTLDTSNILLHTESTYWNNTVLGIWRDVMRRRRFTLLRHCIHVIVTLLKRPLNDHIVIIPTYTLYKVYTFNCYQLKLNWTNSFELHCSFLEGFESRYSLIAAILFVLTDSSPKLWHCAVIFWMFRMTWNINVCMKDCFLLLYYSFIKMF